MRELCKHWLGNQDVLLAGRLSLSLADSASFKPASFQTSCNLHQLRRDWGATWSTLLPGSRPTDTLHHLNADLCRLSLLG